MLFAKCQNFVRVLICHINFSGMWYVIHVTDRYQLSDVSPCRTLKQGRMWTWYSAAKGYSGKYWENNGMDKIGMISPTSGP